MSTRRFNGTRQGEPYHAVVVSRDMFEPPQFEIDVVIFSSDTGRVHYQYSRTILTQFYPYDNTYEGQKSAVRALLLDPWRFER
jgi:hypothetical protein